MTETPVLSVETLEQLLKHMRAKRSVVLKAAVTVHSVHPSHYEGMVRISYEKGTHPVWSIATSFDDGVTYRTSFLPQSEPCIEAGSVHVAGFSAPPYTSDLEIQPISATALHSSSTPRYQGNGAKRR